MESATPCHDTQVVGSFRGPNPLHLTVLAAEPKNYTTAPQIQLYPNNLRRYECLACFSLKYEEDESLCETADRKAAKTSFLPNFRDGAPVIPASFIN